jgi:hypothetical protein
MFHEHDLLFFVRPAISGWDLLFEPHGEDEARGGHDPPLPDSMRTFASSAYFGLISMPIQSRS